MSRQGLTYTKWIVQNDDFYLKIYWLVQGDKRDNYAGVDKAPTKILMHSWINSLFPYRIQNGQKLTVVDRSKRKLMETNFGLTKMTKLQISKYDTFLAHPYDQDCMTKTASYETFAFVDI